MSKDDQPVKLTPEQVAQEALTAAKQCAMKFQNSGQLIAASVNEIGSRRVDGMDVDNVSAKLGYDAMSDVDVKAKQTAVVQGHVDLARQCLTDLVDKLKAAGYDVA